MNKKGFSRFLVLLLTLGMMTLSGVIFHNSKVYGAETILLDPISDTNPLYEEVTKPVQKVPVKKGPALLAETGNEEEVSLVAQSGDLYSTEEAAQFLKPYLLARETGYINLNLISDVTPNSENLVVLVRDILYTSFAYNQEPTQGDYLRWHYSGWSSTQTSVKRISTEPLCYRYQLVLRISYHSTKEQEDQVDSLVAKLRKDLDLSGKSDYEKLTILYDYITDHVSYDNEHVSDTSYSPQYTAYGALHDHVAVCQGYSLLLYRLCLEEGIGCRLISGNDKYVSDGNGGSKLVPDHGWNIVQLDGQWYNLDTTWDAGKEEWSYFLRSMDPLKGFVNHTRSAEYASEEFCQAYPVAQENYLAGTSIPAMRLRSFQICWDGNGGSISPASKLVSCGSKTAYPALEASRTGYHVSRYKISRKSDGKIYAVNAKGKVGWYSKTELADQDYDYAQLTKGQDISTLTVEDGDVINCKALWLTNKYTVKYKANGGSGSMSSQTFTYGVSKDLKSNAFKKTGYSFKGWTLYRASDSKYYAKKKDGSKGWYSASAISKNGYTKVIFSNKASLSKPTKVNGDTLTLTAQWKGHTYTLKYKANGGTGSMSKQTCTYGTTSTLRANAYSKKGYSFKGWTVYKASTEKWYAKKKDGSKGWYSASAIKKYGYTKVVLANRSKVTKLTSSQGAVISLYANWKKK